MLNHARQRLERRYDVGDLLGFTRDGFARREAYVTAIARQESLIDPKVPVVAV